MNYHNNIMKDFSGGRPCVPVDGDAAEQEDQTALRPEAGSIKDYENDSPGGGVVGRETPILLTENHETQNEVCQMAESSAKAEERRERQKPGQYDATLRRLEEIQVKKKKIWSGINKKLGVKIATLNVKGRSKERRSKWPTIVTLMRKQRILVLGVQETHLDEEEAMRISQMCPKIELINNGISKSKEGVAFIINKDLANNMTWSHKELIEGRASRLTIEIEKERGINIIVIYAPNSDNEKIEFFKELKEKLKEEKDMENTIIMGDFNSVENELDRLPHRKDEEKVIESWKKIRSKYGLIDGWRAHNEISKGFTFIQPATNSMSRIDRIYVNDKIYPYGYNWSHESSAEISDHDLVAVEILQGKLPYIGKGIWRMNQEDIKDRNIRKSTDEILWRTKERMENIKTSGEGKIQEVWLETKDEIKNEIEKARKDRRKQLTKEKKKIKSKIEEGLEEINRVSREIREERQIEINELREKLARKSRVEIEKLQKATRARYRKNGEKYTKYWFGLNKKREDSQVILALQKKDGTLTNETKEMMGIALKHHEELQKRPEMTEERKMAIKKLKETSTTKMLKNKKEKLKKKTSYQEIKESLKKAPNGSAPGIDGIIYEFYKDKMTNHEKDNENPDIIKILHMVIEDIEENGIQKRNEKRNRKTSEFTDGLMHLIFKKKEKYKIANYRPITLLNTDYKTYTKTLAIKLADVANEMINEDQAGFVPKRSLYDHTKTTNLAIEYCEMMDKNGCIIALDQEKAYDKIDHDYLWEMMDHYEFPKEFIDRIKELYKSTEKAIIVNGVVTKRYKVERGVHQGDPMSCLLYNFAIEPLADAIRKSKLEGIKVNEEIDRLIVSLFADDTLVYLKKTDNLNELREIIETFCRASTARFNMEKTEYLPIGSKEYRKSVIESRKFGENEIEENVKIVKDGEAMRTLGAWVGNETNANLKWEEILQKQEESINRWEKTNMSLKGKEIILKALIQSKAMFLATVNGMPKHIEIRMKKLFKSFLWDNKKGLMGWNQIISGREQGGLGIPDISARIDAIEIMWIKKWLSPNERKPKWTIILDEILKSNVAKAPMIDLESRISWIKQSWHESEAKDSKISKQIKDILRVARKYNLTLEPLKYSLKTKMEEPLWHNRLMNEANYQWNKKSARCIRKNHNVETIGDLVNNGYETECETKKACNEMKKRLIKLIPEIIDPINQTPKKVKIKNLDLTPTRVKRNEESKTRKIFNPDITARGNVLNNVRIFNEDRGTKTRKRRIEPKKPAYRNPERGKGMETKARLEVLTQNAGSSNQKIKVKINLTKGKKLKTSFQLESRKQSKEKAKAMAMLWILNVEKLYKLKIITTDKKLIKWIGNDIIKAEDKNWLGTKDANLWKAVLNDLRKRNSKTEIRLPKDKEKKKLKSMKEKLKKEDPKILRVTLNRDERYIQKGAKLSDMTQKIAYNLAVHKIKERPGGPHTWRQMEKIKLNLENKWGIKVEEERIWKGIEKIKNTKIQDFIWKMIHDRIKCGKFFKHIPNWQDKQFCVCGKVENIEHILIECIENKQKSLWKLVKKTWKKLTNLKWKKITELDIMSIGTVSVKRRKGQETDLINEILVTLVSTAVWTIWKSRNERVFNETKESKKRLIRLWKESLELEIKIEYEQISQAGRGKIEKATDRFMKKWAKDTSIVKIVVDKEGKGKRRLVLDLWK